MPMGAAKPPTDELFTKRDPRRHLNERPEITMVPRVEPERPHPRTRRRRLPRVRVCGDLALPRAALRHSAEVRVRPCYAGGGA